MRQLIGEDELLAADFAGGVGEFCRQLAGGGLGGQVGSGEVLGEGGEEEDHRALLAELRLKQEKPLAHPGGGGEVAVVDVQLDQAHGGGFARGGGEIAGAKLVECGGIIRGGAFEHRFGDAGVLALVGLKSLGRPG